MASTTLWLSFSLRRKTPVEIVTTSAKIRHTQRPWAETLSRLRVWKKEKLALMSRSWYCCRWWCYVSHAYIDNSWPLFSTTIILLSFQNAQNPSHGFLFCPKKHGARHMTSFEDWQKWSHEQNHPVACKYKKPQWRLPCAEVDGVCRDGYGALLL